MTVDQADLAHRAERDRLLYEQYGRPLEAAHSGQFVAIGTTGALIVGDDDVRVLDDALAKFGRGNFAFRRVGRSAERRWRSLAR